MGKFTFVYKDGVWWLIIRTIDELVDYNEKTSTSTSNQIINGLKSLIVKGFDKVDHYNAAEYLIRLHVKSNNTGICQATEDLLCKKTNAQIKCLLKENNVYINRLGGWNYGKNDFSQWFDSDKMIFTDFTKNDIKIEQFYNGEHYYAYINSMQVRDGDTLKWNTYEEAYNKALEYVNNK